MVEGGERRILCSSRGGGLSQEEAAADAWQLCLGDGTISKSQTIASVLTDILSDPSLWLTDGSGCNLRPWQSLNIVWSSLPSKHHWYVSSKSTTTANKRWQFPSPLAGTDPSVARMVSYLPDKVISYQYTTTDKACLY